MSKPQTSINNKYDRLIALIDMDCKGFTVIKCNHLSVFRMNNKNIDF